MNSSGKGMSKMKHGWQLHNFGDSHVRGVLHRLATYSTKLGLQLSGYPITCVWRNAAWQAAAADLLGV